MNERKIDLDRRKTQAIAMKTFFESDEQNPAKSTILPRNKKSWELKALESIYEERPDFIEGVQKAVQ